MATMKERHKIPHFQYSGGIWYCYRAFDGGAKCYPEYSPTSHAELWYSDKAMARMVEVYGWWKAKDPKNARLTDAMLLRYAGAIRYVEEGSRRKWGMVIKDLRIFAENVGSRFSREYFARAREEDVKRAKTMRGKEQARLVETLIASGYCRVSNNHRIVSRIDRPDWREVLALELCPQDPYGAGIDRTYGSGMADFYRRGNSKDKLTIEDEMVFRRFPGSSDGPKDFVPLCEDLTDAN